MEQLWAIIKRAGIKTWDCGLCKHIWEVGAGRKRCRKCRAAGCSACVGDCCPRCYVDPEFMHESGEDFKWRLCTTIVPIRFGKDVGSIILGRMYDEVIEVNLALCRKMGRMNDWPWLTDFSVWVHSGEIRFVVADWSFDTVDIWAANDGRRYELEFIVGDFKCRMRVWRSDWNPWYERYDGSELVEADDCDKAFGRALIKVACGRHGEEYRYDYGKIQFVEP